ncbi:MULTISPECIES: Crp/Fnr family transcriptional regulator [Glutamicibacter]|uniref:Crp/Fnr family transcriptional regulator n=1 Tax=Glutamicibacter TaxID=1742989 RepID=UPI00167F8BE3|nr:Crp/Fnr family transcriptional regulator [Glutamicibacter nicotianae]
MSEVAATGIQPEALAAWDSSYLRQLPTDIRDTLLAEAFFVSIPAGASIYTPYGASRFGIVCRGQARVQAISEDGRAVTIRYAGKGQIVGLPVVLGTRSPAAARTISDCEILFLNTMTVSRLTRQRLEMAELFLREVTSILNEAIELLADNVFGSVLQRVSRHLLDLAEPTSKGLIVSADQHSIAASIGSVREVVARALRRLREDGLIVSTSGGILLLDKEHLTELGRREHE